MIALITGLIGAVIGGTTARRRKGTAADIAQYAAGFGIAFAILGVFAAVFLESFVLN